MTNAEMDAVQVRDTPMRLQRALTPDFKLARERLVEATDRTGAAPESRSLRGPDEVQFAFHPTLTRVWCLKGRRGQRLVEAPGDHRKVNGFGLVDWRDGWFDGRIAAFPNF